MQLLIAGLVDDSYEEFTNGLKTFKFRNEVKLLGGVLLDELAKVTAAAYAFVYPSLYEDIALPPLEAMQCGVPVITSNTGALPEMLADAALYVNPADFNDIAEKMMLVFKDENKKNELVSKGHIRVQQFTPDMFAGQLWQAIEKCNNTVNQ